MTTTTNSADPYFANLDYMEMFGINKGEQSKLKSI
jgi:hypothetical protein